MKKCFAVLTLCCIAGSAQAGSTIQDAIQRRDDLSMFYQALLNTGVIHELDSGSFSVFAPTNEAFEKISKDKYPCFYTPQCKEQVADILRHHIVSGEIYADTTAGHQGGTYAVDGTFLSIAEPYKNKYSAGGQNITSTNMLGGNMLYKIDGVIATPTDLALLKRAPDGATEAETVQPGPAGSRPVEAGSAEKPAITNEEHSPITPTTTNMLAPAR